SSTVTFTVASASFLLIAPETAEAPPAAAWLDLLLALSASLTTGTESSPPVSPKAPLIPTRTDPSTSRSSERTLLPSRSPDTIPPFPSPVPLFLPPTPPLPPPSTPHPQASLPSATPRRTTAVLADRRASSLTARCFSLNAPPSSPLASPPSAPLACSPRPFTPLSLPCCTLPDPTPTACPAAPATPDPPHGFTYDHHEDFSPALSPALAPPAPPCNRSSVNCFLGKSPPRASPPGSAWFLGAFTG
ncbi:unnamed protein product, partial [Closterium sp. NIES-53]